MFPAFNAALARSPKWQPGGGNLAAIALTAYAREQDQRGAEEAVFHTHVAKPVESSELVRAVLGLGRSFSACGRTFHAKTPVKFGRMPA